ncbi:hypothetical protein HQ563_12530 [bacterium]|nr:hypothetical protein [bacterium]
MTEVFSTGRCDKCGGRVGFEDGIRQDLCPCDPRCDRCGRQFIPSPRTCGGRICDECIEKEIFETFSEEFLRSLSADQMAALIRDVSRTLE